MEHILIFTFQNIIKISHLSIISIATKLYKQSHNVLTSILRAGPAAQASPHLLWRLRQEDLEFQDILSYRMRQRSGYTTLKFSKAVAGIKFSDRVLGQNVDGSHINM